MRCAALLLVLTLISGCRQSLTAPAVGANAVVCSAGPHAGLVELRYDANPYFGHPRALRADVRGENLVLTARWDEPVDLTTDWDVYFALSPSNQVNTYPSLVVARGSAPGEGNIFRATYWRESGGNTLLIGVIPFSCRGTVMTWTLPGDLLEHPFMDQPPVRPTHILFYATTVVHDGPIQQGLWVAPFDIEHPPIAAIDR